MKKIKLFKSIVLAFATLLVVSCSKGGGGSDEPIDYSENSAVRLSLDYAGHDFFSDGIAQVTLKTPIDGDTAHFYTSNNKIIKSRFWGVDTPESTGRIEEYGAEASLFTKTKLKEAKTNGTIVVSTARSDYGEPSADSTGERYVSLIWISLDKKNAPFKELRLLNLLIVQEGLSYVKNISDIPEYGDIFIAAESQAKKLKLNLWSGKPAEMFNYGDYQTTSLLDIKHEIEKNIEAKIKGETDVEYTLNGAKVRVVGTVSGFSDGTMYIQNFYTVEEGGNGNVTNPYTKEKGEYAGINIFCGMSSVPGKYRTPGTYIEICGNVVVSDVFGYQLTGAEGHFPIVESLAEDDDCKIIISAENNTEEYQLFTFEYSANDLDNHIKSTDVEVKYESFYCSTKLTEAVECTKFYKSNAGEITLTFGSHKFQAYLTTTYRGNPKNTSQYWNEEEKFVGKSFYISGVFAAYTGGNTPRFQFVFTTPNTQLLCTDYYNADGTVKE